MSRIRFGTLAAIALPSGLGAFSIRLFAVALTLCPLLFGQGVSFNSPKDYSVGRGPAGIIAADFNLDGKLDIAIADSTSGSVSVLLGDGEENFKPALNSAAGVSASAIAVADFNHVESPTWRKL